MTLKESFFQLTNGYSPQQQLQDALWLEIEKAYTEKHRHYHTLQHLEALLIELNEVKGYIKQWDTLLFTLFYHDFVYKSTAKDNEEASALIAKERLSKINFPALEVERCYNQILATKSHTPSEDVDTNYFLDADLSVLGKPWEIYDEYRKNVRKEYRIYPDFLYNPGRKKVLTHFLEMGRIYKTDYFYNKFQQQAALNLKKELELLK